MKTHYRNTTTMSCLLLLGMIGTLWGNRSSITTDAFVLGPKSHSRSSSGGANMLTPRRFVSSPLASSTEASETSKTKSKLPTNEWELDCYSRPVLLNGGKKLWEVLITDSTGQLRICETLPSSRVNSRELRRVVQEAIEQAPVKPKVIRFFRGAVFNMINIALTEIPSVETKPSRATYSLIKWIEERNRNVYPLMKGYKPTMATSAAASPSFLDIRTPTKLPDALRGEKYAFVSLPLAEFREGGGITSDNIGVGKICPIDDDLPSDAFVTGLVILSSRAKALSKWLAGTEICSLKVDLKREQLLMDSDISTQYLMARLNDSTLLEEGKAFEQSKASLGGLHFMSVQMDDDSDPEGFWLLREIYAVL